MPNIKSDKVDLGIRFYGNLIQDIAIAMQIYIQTPWKGGHRKIHHSILKDISSSLLLLKMPSPQRLYVQHLATLAINFDF